MDRITHNMIKYDHPGIGLALIVFLFSFVTLETWKKYSLEPTSMIHFGQEFVDQNREYMPDKAIVEKGSEGDLGAGYDGQIFYFYSRTINSFSQNWPKGFDESYRAPRIGYPLLISITGVFGPGGAIFGMYFWNVLLFSLSYLALRGLLERYSYLSIFYVLSPFALGSYSVLVSDTVMMSLVIISYYFYRKEKYFLFIPLASLAILTKEPAFFLYFPLGLSEFFTKKWKKSLIVLSILIIPFSWHFYLHLTFPNWKPTRLADFIAPMEVISTYLSTLFRLGSEGDLREIARALSRLPLLILLVLGIHSSFIGISRRGRIYRLGLLLNFFMIFSASYYHFWSVYENVSRMFTFSVPLMILLAKEDGEIRRRKFFYTMIFVLFLFLIKVALIQKAQIHILWEK